MNRRRRAAARSAADATSTSGGTRARVGRCATVSSSAATSGRRADRGSRRHARPARQHHRARCRSDAPIVPITGFGIRGFREARPWWRRIGSGDGRTSGAGAPAQADASRLHRPRCAGAPVRAGTRLVRIPAAAGLGGQGRVGRHQEGLELRRHRRRARKQRSDRLRLRVPGVGDRDALRDRSRPGATRCTRVLGIRSAISELERLEPGSPSGGKCLVAGTQTKLLLPPGLKPGQDRRARRQASWSKRGEVPRGCQVEQDSLEVRTARGHLARRAPLPRHVLHRFERGRDRDHQEACRPLRRDRRQDQPRERDEGQPVPDDRGCFS